MSKASIVPDTNVFISNLDVIKAVFNHKFPDICTLNISRTVLQELDGLKKEKKEARDAIKFIESISLSLKTEIEGHVDDRKIDVEVEYKEAVQESNNDDKIMNYIFKLENPVFLTNDVGFALKCQSFNIKVLSIKEDSASTVIFKILEILGTDQSGSLMQHHTIMTEIPLHPQTGRICNKKEEEKQHSDGKPQGEGTIDPNMQKIALDNFKRDFKNAIEPRIQQILLKEIGEGYSVLLKGNLNLEFYLKLITKNFFLFKNYFPKNSVSFINPLLKALKNGDIEAVLSNAKVVYVMFGLIPGQN